MKPLQLRHLAQFVALAALLWAGCVVPTSQRYRPAAPSYQAPAARSTARAVTRSASGAPNRGGGSSRATVSGLRGLGLLIIHTSSRVADARQMQTILQGAGVDAELSATSDQGNDPHNGSVYYKAGYSSQAAAIANMVGHIETVRPRTTGADDNPRKIYLWVTTTRTTRPSSGVYGAQVLLIHTAGRADDARRAKSLLEAAGADVKLSPTSDQGNEPHNGSVYYKAGHLQQAEMIASLVGSVETVRPRETSSDDNPRTIYLWITSSRRGASNLHGTDILIVHTSSRYSDASQAKSILDAAGATATLSSTSDYGNDPHTGSCYYKVGYYDQCLAISQLVSHLESVSPREADPDNNPSNIYLWFTR